MKANIMKREDFAEEIKKYLRSKKIRQKDMAERLNLNHSTINNLINGHTIFGKQSSIQWGEILGIDPLWLMTQGEQGVNPNDGDTPTTAIAKADPDTINVPVLNLDVRGGLAYNDVTDIEEYKVGVMPFSRQIATEGDVVVPVYGESMTPRYPNGSHILIRPLPRWREWLELGNAYVLELADWRRTIKIVRKGSTPDSYRLECYNVDFDTTEIPKSLIEHIWQVLACVKREVM